MSERPDRSPTELPAAEPALPSTGGAPASGFARFVDWLLCRSELEVARLEATRGERDTNLVQRAISAFEAGSTLLEVPAGKGEIRSWGSFAALFLDSLYLCLLSSRRERELDEMPGLEVLWQQARPTIDALRLDDDHEKTMAELVAMKRPSVELSTLPEREQQAKVAIACNVALRALELAEAPRRSVTKVLRKSAVRVAGALIVLGLVISGALALIPAPSDLAQAKPWTTSSKLASCTVANKCLTSIFFHTDEEDNPWLQYDIGPGHAYSSMKITNRPDGYQERAVPLVVEVSHDGRVFREIARRNEVFRIWKPSFGEQSARFVRLRVARRSYLHLGRVEIYR